MSKYQVKFYKGDYPARQRAANAEKAVGYFEQHFNSGSASANYALAVVGTNASQKSKAVAADYVRRICAVFGTSPANNDFASGGVSVGGYMRRGNANLTGTNMPAVLLEPLFASNPMHVEQIKSEQGQLKLARCLAGAIIEAFPKGGLIAFSVGHKGRTSKPRDRGVELVGGGMEADYAEIVLNLAKEILES